MSRLLPFRSSVTPRPDREPKLVTIDDEAADEVFEALSSRTARTIFSSLHETPATASDLAEVADTSLQNVRYHLDKLTEAGLIEISDTWYSDRGREMKVYAPANTSLVMLSGERPPETTLRNLLQNLIGGIGVLAIASVLVDRVVTTNVPSVDPATSMEGSPTATATRTLEETATAMGGGDGPSPTPQFVPVTGTPARDTAFPGGESTPIPEGTTTPAGGFEGGSVIEPLGVGLPPGALFFVGGLFVLLLATAWHYRRTMRYRA